MKAHEWKQLLEGRGVDDRIIELVCEMAWERGVERQQPTPSNS